MKTRIIRDRRFFLESAVFVALLYGVAAFVYLSGDDFMYGSFAHTGLLTNVADYYVTGNGRFWINILDSALLRFDRYAFILVLPWIVLAFVVLFAKVVQRLVVGHANWEKEKDLIRMGMVLFACLDILCLRETVFWITGMMNYLFPAVVFLLGYLLFLKSRSGELRGIGHVVYYVVCLLASSSVEQFALMFVGMMTLHHGWDLIRRKRIPTAEWAAYAISLVGLATLLLAPGNFARVDEQSVEMPSLFVNAWTLISQNTSSPVAVPYLLMMVLAATVRKGTLRRLELASILAGLVGCLISPVLDKAVFDIAMVGLIAWPAVMVLFRERVAPGVLFLIFVGLCSQGMLLISAIWGFRCMLSMYIVYMLLIGYFLYHAQAEKRHFVLAVGLMASVHPALALVLCVAYWTRPRPLVGVLPTAIRCAVVLLLVNLLLGYGSNAAVHRQNLQRTAEIQNNTIIIDELPNDLYSWYFVPIGEFHEEYYRVLHEIPEFVQIEYRELAE